MNTDGVLSSICTIGIHLLVMLASLRALVWLATNYSTLALLVLTLLLSNYLWRLSEWIFKGIHDNLLYWLDGYNKGSK